VFTSMAKSAVVVSEVLHVETSLVSCGSSFQIYPNANAKEINVSVGRARSQRRRSLMHSP
jgi:hypothetical protein